MFDVFCHYDLLSNNLLNYKPSVVDGNETIVIAKNKNTFLTMHLMFNTIENNKEHA